MAELNAVTYVKSYVPMDKDLQAIFNVDKSDKKRGRGVLRVYFRLRRISTAAAATTITTTTAMAMYVAVGVGLVGGVTAWVGVGETG